MVYITFWEFTLLMIIYLLFTLIIVSNIIKLKHSPLRSN